MGTGPVSGVRSRRFLIAAETVRIRSRQRIADLFTECLGLRDDVHTDLLAPRVNEAPEHGSRSAVADRQAVDPGAWQKRKHPRCDIRHLSPIGHRDP